MKKVRRLAPIPALMLALLMLCTFSAAAEVTIIRTLPESGTNQAEAEWKSPAAIDGDRAAAASAAGAPAARLSGRIIVGGYGSGSEEEVTIDDWSTDSLLNYQSFLGENGLLDIQAQAYRDTGIDSFEQRYNGSLGFSKPSFSVKMSGNYNQSELTTLDGENVETDAAVGLDISTSEEVRIPFQLAYSSSWDQRDYESTGDSEEAQEEDHSLQLSSELPFDRVVFSLDGGFDIHHDRLDDVSTTGYGGTLGCTFNLTELIGLYAGASPSYSATEYQLADKKSEERSIESDAGVLLTFSEKFEGEVHASRIDAWRSDPEFIEDDLSHTSIWQGATEWSLQAPEELTSTAAYEISREEGGSLSHDVSGDSTWEQEEGVLRKTGARFRYLLVDSAGGLSRSESIDWGSFLSLEPADMMSFDTDYSGSWSDDEGNTVQHDAGLDFSHNPVEGFGYGAGAGYAYEEDADNYSSKYSGTGRVNLVPVIGYKELNLELSELLEFEDASDGENILSRTSFSSGYPLTKEVRLRYTFSWEWIDLEAAGEDDGSAFLHTAGFTLSGPKVPFSFNSSYLVGHGFRGVQHQVDARLEVPLRKSFNLISKLSYRYAETVTYETPFLFSTFAHYEF